MAVLAAGARRWAASARGWPAAWAAGWRNGNPVLLKELRTRMRGVRAYWVVFAYLALLAAAVLITYYNYWLWWERVEGGETYYSRRNAADIGRTVFYVLFCTQGVLVALITPALTSGAITMEREQQTYELLATSRLSAGAVVRGKLGAGVLFVLLLLTCSLPLVGVSLFFGGVGPDQILWTYLILAACALVYGALGLACSTVVRRTAGATVAAYVAAVVLTVVAPLLGRFLHWTGYRDDSFVPLKGLAAVTAPVMAAAPEHFYRWNPPAWIAGAALNLLLGSLLALIAAEQLEGFDARRPALRRLLATAAWTLFWLSIAGTEAAYSGTRSGDLRGVSLLAVLLVLAVAPVLATGTWQRPAEGAKPLRGGILNPVNWFTDSFPAGAGLLVLWVAIPLGAAGIGYAMHGPGAASFPVEARAYTSVLGGLTLAAVGLGRLWSAAARPRLRAGAATCASLALLAIGPHALLTDTALPLPAGSAAPLRWQIAYLLPMEALYRTHQRPPFHPALLLDGVVPTWYVTGAVYAGVGLAAALAAALVRRRIGRL